MISDNMWEVWLYNAIRNIPMNSSTGDAMAVEEKLREIVRQIETGSL